MSQKLSLCYNKIPCVFPVWKKVRTKFRFPCAMAIQFKTVVTLQNRGYNDGQFLISTIMPKWSKNRKIAPWDLCWLKQWYIDQVLKKYFPTCCLFIIVNKTNFSEVFLELVPFIYFMAKTQTTFFPILGKFFLLFFTIFNILIIINNLLQNLVWSCRFKCTQNWAALSCH